MYLERICYPKNTIHPMSFEQLIELYILQKNYHLYPTINTFQNDFETKYAELTANAEIVAIDCMAPARFKGQPDIPFVLFKSKDATEHTPRPLIIHTHGGPHVYMDKHKPHAEIGYFLSHGYVVACPNYRGSTNYPDLDDKRHDWEQWVEKSKEKHHIYGPEDVYAVAKHMHTLPFVDKDKTFLRGGSYGSYINAHLLVEIKKGKFDNIFKGVHLSGGVKYPVAATFPGDIPILITHSEKDEIAPCADAKIFMEKLLLKQLASEYNAIPAAPIETFVAQLGDHHLIDPALSEYDDTSDSYQELVHYLILATTFIHNLNLGEIYQVNTPILQFKKLMDRPDTPDETIQKKIVAYHHSTTLNPAPSISIESMHMDNTVPPDKTHPITYGPTLALLKLQLKEQFTGDIRTDFSNFLQNHFTPIDASKKRVKLTNAGQLILSDKAFIEQMIQLIEQEERFLKEHPDHMVMYHAADNNVLQLYCFINLWQMILKETSITELPVIKEMRLYDFMKQSFDDIEIFLTKMRQRDPLKKTIFNNIPGFADRAIACNPALISNAHHTASCSLWWYFNAKMNGQRVPIDNVIGDFLKILGIYSKERVARYLQLFEKESQRLQDNPQALMQQIFVPYEVSEKTAYLCLLWGEEFKPNSLKLHSPETIRSLLRDPVDFETLLREIKQVFTNFGEYENFGKTDEGFNYANALQIRYLPQNHTEITTNSYVRSRVFYQQFISELGQLIREDYADYLVNDHTIPDFILSGADEAKCAFYKNNEFVLFKSVNNSNHDALFMQQRELYLGLVQNPCKAMYGSIISLDKPTKTVLQERLRAITGNESPHPVFPYSLCRYLKGYSYYDLLKEAATSAYLNEQSSPKAKSFFKQKFDLIMEMIDHFSVPKSIDTVEINGQNYSTLYDAMHEDIKTYAFNSKQHQFLHPPKATYYDIKLWDHELSTAVESVLRYARLAKEKSYGHNISQRKIGLY